MLDDKPTHATDLGVVGRDRLNHEVRRYLCPCGSTIDRATASFKSRRKIHCLVCDNYILWPDLQVRSGAEQAAILATRFGNPGRSTRLL